jgi:hypothetical protein
MNLTTLEAQGSVIAMQSRLVKVSKEVAGFALIAAKSETEVTQEERFNGLFGLIEELAGKDQFTKPVRITHGVPDGVKEVTIRLGAITHTTDMRYPNSPRRRRIISDAVFMPEDESGLTPVPVSEVAYDYDVNVNTPAYDPVALTQITDSLRLFIESSGVVELPLVEAGSGS